MPANSANSWLIFSLLTVGCWGVYGILLHTGSLGMSPADGSPDPNARYKAFLWVGIAYFLIAVLAPLAILIVKNTGWSMPARGIWWSLLAGVAGAIGAFCVLLAFGAKGHPAVVMSIIFAGAPIVNAIIAISIHPPAGGIASIRWQFVLGIVLAAVGGLLVTLYKPPPGKPKTDSSGPTVQHVEHSDTKSS